MPDTKLSALTTVTNPVVGTDTIYLVRAGASYKTTVADLPASSGGGSGDVVGPASATDNVPAIFDGTTGKLLKNGAGVLGTAAYTAATAYATAAQGTDARTPTVCPGRDRPAGGGRPTRDKSSTHALVVWQ